MLRWLNFNTGLMLTSFLTTPSLKEKGNVKAMNEDDDV